MSRAMWSQRCWERASTRAYDPELLEMAKSWKFKPATKDGVPVRYRTTVEVRLGPG